MRYFSVCLILALSLTSYGYFLLTTSGSFTPATPDNLELWFDGNDNDGSGNGPTNDDTSGDVGTWHDKSGNNLDAIELVTPPDYAGSALNSLACINFNGTDEYLTVGDHADLDCQTGCTIGFVAVTAGSLAHGRIISKQESGTGPFGWGVAFPSFSSTADITWVVFGDSTSSTSWHGRTGTTEVTTSTAYSFVVDYNGGTAGPTDLRVFKANVQVDDATQNTGGSFPPDDESAMVRLGARNLTPANFFSGDICEMVFYSDLLTDGERGNLFTYFNTKWGV